MGTMRLKFALSGAAMAGLIAAAGSAAAETDVKLALDWKFEGPAAP